MNKKGKLAADQSGRPLQRTVKTIELGPRKLVGQGIFDIGEMGRQSNHIESPLHPKWHSPNHLADGRNRKTLSFCPGFDFQVNRQRNSAPVAVIGDGLQCRNRRYQEMDVAIEVVQLTRWGQNP